MCFIFFTTGCNIIVLDYLHIPNFSSQACKFVGGDNNPQARDIVEEIKLAKCPEEAFRIGRSQQKRFPELVCLNIMLLFYSVKR